MYNRRNPYLGQGAELPQLPPSPYFAQDDEGQSPTVAMAMGLADPNNSRYGITPRAGGGGGGGRPSQDEGEEPVGQPPPEIAPESEAVGKESDEPAADSPYLSKPVSWAKTAPEAAGSEGFSTTPENRPPRSSQPIQKADVPRINSNPDKSPTKWDQVRKLDAEIAEKRRKAGSGWMSFLNTISPLAVDNARSELAGLRHDRNVAAREAMYEDNQKGANEAAKQAAINARASERNAARIKEREIASAHYATAKPYEATLGGKKGAWIQDPSGNPRPYGPSVEDQGPPEEGKPYLSHTEQFESLGDEKAKPGTPHYFTDDSGNVTSIDPATGERKKLGRIGQTKVHPEGESREDKEQTRIETEARAEARKKRDEYEHSMKGSGKSESEIERAGDEIYRRTYEKEGGKKEQPKYRKGFQRPVKNEKTGMTEMWTWDGDKFNPPAKRLGFAVSHK